MPTTPSTTKPSLPPGWPRRGMWDAVVAALSRPELLRPLFGAARRLAPVLPAGSRVLVTRHADVVDVLRRDTDFTVAELNGPPMERWSGAFILGMDRGERYDREAAALHRAAPAADVARVRSLVAASAADLVAAARPTGRLDMVGGLARPAAARTVARYYGVPGPDEATLQRWLRAMFDAVFLDAGRRASAAARLTAAESRPYMEALIRRRRAEVAAGDDVPDDVLTRLVAMAGEEPWLDDDGVRRSINGIIVGAVDTTSKAVTHIVDELLRRPVALDAARRAALDGDIDQVRGYAWEALRFRPHAPLLQRQSHGAQVGGRTVPAGKKVLVGVMAAMFDPAAFPHPGGFRPDRPEERYLHFGHGMHTCFGLSVNRVQIPELVAAVVALPGLRRAPGREGHIVYDGPFPDRLVLAFDEDER
ncbi:MAG TPA: cytochrome P450 [Acidimicrobiales bacterium]|nr:cytochrome P450 [Acidimicrobiales bacterium]